MRSACYFRIVGILIIFTAGVLAACSGYKSQNNIVKTGDRMEVYSDKHIEYLLSSYNRIQTLDPQIADSNDGIFVSALFDALAEYDSAATKLEPSLAIKWDKNGDSTVWTFYLRKDAKWTDGKFITANDFVYSWLRALNPDEAAYRPELLYCIRNARKYNQGQALPEEVGIKALDDATLQVTMEKPAPFFEKLITRSIFRPVPRQAIEKFGKDWTKFGNIVSSGAFRLAGWDTIGGSIAVERNESFRDNSNTKLFRIIFYPPDSPEIRGKSAIELYGKSVIGATRNLTSQALLKADEKDLLIAPSNGVIFAAVNTTIKPFDDERVRKALSLAINRDKLIETGISQYPSASLIPPMAGYENVKDIGFNPDEARRLLAEAGFPGGKNFPEVEYIYPDSDANTTTAEFVKGQLEKELGIKIKLNNLSFKDYLLKRTKLDFKGLAAVGWVGDYLDPNSFFDVYNTDDIPTGWKDENYTTILNNANLESDPVKRYGIFRAAETFLLKHQPLIPLYVAADKVLCKPYIKNLAPNPLGQVNWREVYVDKKP